MLVIGRTVSLDRIVNQLAARAVHGEHVEEYFANLWIEVASDGRAGRDIGLHDVADDLDGLRVLKDAGVLMSGLNDLVPGSVRQCHELRDESLLRRLLSLGTNHVAASLVEGMYLLRRQIAGDLAHVTHDLINEGFRLARLC